MKQANPSHDYDNVRVVEIDVAKQASIQAAADFVKATYGNVHVLINKAGISGQSEGAEMCLQVNVFGVYDTLSAFHPLPVPGQSSNIVVGSRVGAASLSAMPPELQEIFQNFHALDIETLEDLKEDWLLHAHGKPSHESWPELAKTYGPYGVSKAMVMSLTRK
ncbi:NADH-cytochrome b5 reductase [Aphanomyces cochlioides]|nr:NADH-cytochrome b5 reductase [Aphanomyces cochlioides]